MMRLNGRHARRLLPPTAVAAVTFAAGGASAAAAASAHIKRTVGPIVGDVPAGALCDFAYHEEDSYLQNLTQFTDTQGNLVRVEDKVDVTILHRNAETGQTLVERLHYAAHVDFVSRVARVTGQSWQLRDVGGRLVLSGAGLIDTDLATGEVLGDTPNAKSDAAATICTALGGAPA